MKNFTGDGHFSDVSHVDALGDMKSRIYGLRLAICGLQNEVSAEDFRGLVQLVEDIADAMEKCSVAFEVAHNLRIEDHNSE